MKNTWKIMAVLAVLMFMTVPAMAVTSWATGEAYASPEGAAVMTAAGSFKNTMSSSAGTMAIGNDVSSSSGTIGTSSELFSMSEAEGIFVLGGSSAEVIMTSNGVHLNSDADAGALVGSVETYSYATNVPDNQATIVGASATGILAGASAVGRAINWEGEANIDTDASAILGSASVVQISEAPGNDAGVEGLAHATGVYAGTNAYVSSRINNVNDVAVANMLAGASGYNTEIAISTIGGLSFVEMTASSVALGFGAESTILSSASAQES